MTDLDYITRALELAARGRGFVEPNPMVGAVVVRDGVVVGEGWHERYGEAHAEVNALKRAGEKARGATLYVTLEPCCHHGKTPPCTDAVIAAGIRRVVASMRDPFAAVAGRGLIILREAGVEVVEDIGGPAARSLNAPYLTFLRAGRPWIHGKWAMSLDGKIASFTGSSQWITSDSARANAHELRGRMDGILIGRGTLATDDPILTARPAGPRQATRIVLTSGQTPLPDTCRLLQTVDEAPVLVIGDSKYANRFEHWRQRGAEIVALPELDAGSIAAELGRRRMTNVLIEGGPRTLGTFMDARLIDEVHAYIAPKLIGGETAPSAIGGQGIAKIDDALMIRDWKWESLGADLYGNGRVVASGQE